MIVMVTGGARSGKSSFAERWCMKHAKSASYIATAQPFDAEMEQRIALHRKDREAAGYRWETIEEPLKLVDLVMELQGSINKEHRGQDGTQVADSGNAWEYPSVEQAEQASAAVLVDCLTLWLSNVLRAAGEAPDTEEKVTQEIDRLVQVVASYTGTLIMVTNEVGSGIVPAYALGRLYRDMAGMLNRRIAAIADQVFLVTAGIPIELKSREYML
ncbi:Bifunctional adenosylcobalamin biosynthesis protein CobP [compost metagenome]